MHEMTLLGVALFLVVGCGDETSGSTSPDAAAEALPLMCEGVESDIVVPDGCPTDCSVNGVGDPPILNGQSCEDRELSCPSLVQCDAGTFWTDCECVATGLLNQWSCMSATECTSG